MARSFLSLLVDLVAPPRKTDALVRALSVSSLRAIMLRGDTLGSLPYHDERVRALVWELKYYANARAAMLGAHFLSEVLISIAAETLGKPVLIPTPMHAQRKHQRGHNQTEVLCEALLPYVGEYFDYRPTVLVRTRNTHQQQGLERHMRLINIEGSMGVPDPAPVRGRVCVVVDDVSTTGATFDEAKRALKAAGAQHVECVALAQS